MILTLIVIFEIFWFCLGGILFTYRPGRRISEAMSLGLIIALMLLSLIFQVSFLIGRPKFSFVLELIASLGFLFMVIKRREELRRIIYRIREFTLKNKILCAVLLLCWSYLFLLAVVIPPSNHDSMIYNLSRVLLFERENSLLLKNVNVVAQAIHVVSSDILSYSFLRFYSDYGVGIFSFLSYISIGFGTYALSRKYSSYKISILSTLVITSLPELCFQATSTKNDILTAALAVFCFIIVSRLLEKFNVLDLWLIVLGLIFGFSVKTTFFAFITPFTLIFGFILIKQLGVTYPIKVLTHNWFYAVIFAVPILIFSQSWLLIHNLSHYNDLTGNATYPMLQNDGFRGASANLVRYFFQSFHLFPIDAFFRGIFKVKIGDYISNLYHLLFGSFFGDVSLWSKAESFSNDIYPYEKT